MRPSVVLNFRLNIEDDLVFAHVILVDAIFKPEYSDPYFRLAVEILFFPLYYYRAK